MLKKLLLLSFVSSSLIGFAQDKDQGELHGNFQFDGQYYVRDSILDPSGEAYPDERFLGQGFFNLVYTKGKFTAGARYENYQNVMVGFPQGYKGQGITYRYLQYSNEGLDVTAGNFYEQFGSGMILRTYEERGLGYDNNIDGVRVKYTTKNGVTLKGVIGKQRNYFDVGEGIVRGFDAEVRLNDLITPLNENKTIYTVGGSFVSKFQPDNDPFLNLPQNVGSSAARINVNRGNFNIYSEYVYKINDPNADNNFIYKPGEAFTFVLNYATKSWGLTANFKRVDNMSYRSERNAQQTEVLINYIPAITKYHTYSLPALYPYATQINGEMGVQLEFTYNFKKGSFLGGKYGTQMFVNFAAINSLDKQAINDSTPIGTKATDGYTSEFFKFGPTTYYRDFNIAFKSKINRKWKATFTYLNVQYNYTLLNKGASDLDMLENGYSLVFLNEFILELQYKIKPKHYLRMEFQALLSEQDKEGKTFDELAAGSMALALIEYSISPSWFFSVQNNYNFGNPDEEYRLNYPYVSISHVKGPTRVQLGYGRQPSGIFCVGGVCRFVPASNGLNISITSNF